MDTKYTRTTITLPEELLYEIKKKALAEKKTIKDMINESLSLYVGYSRKKTRKVKKDSILSLFGAWGKGESGAQYLKRIRYNKMDIERDKYLEKLWKKSS